MSINEMDSRVKELRELRRMADELAAEIESITDSIKADMDAEGVDTISGVDWKVTYKTVTASRLDTSAFKKARRRSRRSSQSPQLPAVSASHEKSPLPERRPKQQAKSLTPASKEARKGKSIIPFSSLFASRNL